MPDCDFIALDVETANSKPSSICQVGLAYFLDGKIVDTWLSYVNPDCEFSHINKRIHGISQEDVIGAMAIPQMLEELGTRLSGQVVAHHTHFDRTALRRCADEYKQDRFFCRWVDTASVVRSLYPDVRSKGYGLTELAKKFNLEFTDHHNALADAILAGKILSIALEEAGAHFSDWAVYDFQLAGLNIEKIERPGNPDGKFFGNSIKFHGELLISHERAAQLAAKRGFNVKAKVSPELTHLVIGASKAPLDNSENINILLEKEFYKLIGYKPPAKLTFEQIKEKNKKQKEIQEYNKSINEKYAHIDDVIEFI